MRIADRLPCAGEVASGVGDSAGELASGRWLFSNSGMIYNERKRESINGEFWESQVRRYAMYEVDNIFTSILYSQWAIASPYYKLKHTLCDDFQLYYAIFQVSTNKGYILSR